MRLNRYLVENDARILERGPEIWEKLTTSCGQYLKEYKNTGLVGKHGRNTWLYRGSSRSTMSIRHIASREDRQPKDMPYELHSKFDELFYKKFKWYARSSGVFTVASKRTAQTYGAPLLFFPVGKYRYVWSPDISDLYSFADQNNLLSYSDDYDDYYTPPWWEEEYNELYGEGGDGEWYYDREFAGGPGHSRSDVEMTIEDDIGDLYDPGLLEWRPNVDWDEFVQQKQEEKAVDQEKEIEDAVNTYINKNLKDAIKSSHEVAFDCRSYYLVDDIYMDFISSMILKGGYQLKLPFKAYNLDWVETRPKWFLTKGGNVVQYNG